MTNILARSLYLPCSLIRYGWGSPVARKSFACLLRTLCLIGASTQDSLPVHSPQGTSQDDTVTGISRFLSRFDSPDYFLKEVYVLQAVCEGKRLSKIRHFAPDAYGTVVCIFQPSRLRELIQ